MLNHQANAGIMLGRRLRRRLSINPRLPTIPVIAGGMIANSTLL